MMENKDLIEKLKTFPEDMEVCVFDWRQNLSNDWGDGSSAGVYDEFEVNIMDKDSIPEGSKPWLAIGIKNDDYDDDGLRVDS